MHTYMLLKLTGLKCLLVFADGQLLESNTIHIYMEINSLMSINKTLNKQHFKPIFRLRTSFLPYQKDGMLTTLIFIYLKLLYKNSWAPVIFKLHSF